VTSANIVFQITSHRHPMGIFGRVSQAFVYSHMGHSFMGDLNDLAPGGASIIGCFIGVIWTVSTVIPPFFKKKSVNKDPTRMVGVLADNVIKRISGSGFSKAVILVAFQLLGELERANIEGSGGLDRERVIVINSGIRDW